MIDWKILAGGVIALVAVSTLFLGGIGEGFGGLGDIFGSISEKLSEWFGSSPFGSFMPTTSKATTKVVFTLHTDNFTLSPSSAFSAEFGNAEVEEFSGSIIIDEKIILQSKDTKIKISGNVEVSDLYIKSLELEEAKFDILPNASADSGALEIQNFQGSAIVTPENITFDGNVTKLIANIGGLNWELKA